MKIRQGKFQDHKKFLELAEKYGEFAPHFLWPSYYNADNYNDPEQDFFVAENDEGLIVGFVYGHYQTPVSYYIKYIIVDKNNGKGVGNSLMRYVEKNRKTKYFLMLVNEKDVRGKEWIKKLGYEFRSTMSGDPTHDWYYKKVNEDDRSNN